MGCGVSVAAAPQRLSNEDATRIKQAIRGCRLFESTTEATIQAVVNNR